MKNKQTILPVDHKAQMSKDRYQFLWFELEMQCLFHFLGSSKRHNVGLFKRIWLCLRNKSKFVLPNAALGDCELQTLQFEFSK